MFVKVFYCWAVALSAAAISIEPALVRRTSLFPPPFIVPSGIVLTALREIGKSLRTLPTLVSASMVRAAFAGVRR
jgi:hypothetical protein